MNEEGSELRAEHTRQELEALKEDLKAMRADLRSVLHSARADGEGTYGELKMRLRQSIRGAEKRAHRRLQDTYDRLYSKGHDAAERARDSVESRPFAAILVSALVGMVLGQLLRRR